MHGVAQFQPLGAITMNPVAIIHIVAGIMVIFASIPLIKRKIPMNSIYGVKIPRAYESKEKWYDINQYGGRLLLKFGAILFFTAIAGLAIPVAHWVTYDLGSTVIVLVCLGYMLMAIFRYANQDKST